MNETFKVNVKNTMAQRLFGDEWWSDEQGYAIQGIDPRVSGAFSKGDPVNIESNIWAEPCECPIGNNNSIRCYRIYKK